MSRIRQREIHARRKRQQQLLKLRERYSGASAAEKQRTIEKLGRISPGVTSEEFLGGAKKK